MCGLVAIFSKSKSTGFLYQDKNIFQQMLISDMFRGMDSTGCFGVKANGNLDMIKDASPAPYLIGKKEAGDKFFDNIISKYHVVVGHNRKATLGVVNAENAHPFIEENICLVHNGTLQNHHKLAKTVVDSHAICHNINAEGYKNTLKNIEGAYALIWYNAEDKTMYFCRNAERPLFLVETSDRIYLASEGKMLDWLLDRNNISKYTIQNVPTDKVFKFSLETRKLECESKPKKANPPVVVQNQSQWHSHRGNQSTRHSTFGQLALAHSSDSLKASINTYSSGETICWKIVDFDIGEKTIKIMGETQDLYKTNVVFYMPTATTDINELDTYVSCSMLEGDISSISSKRGDVIIYLKNMRRMEHLITQNNKRVSSAEIIKAGGVCYSCGTTIQTPLEVFEANITLDSNGNIIYMSCGECAEHDSHNTYRKGYC